VSRLVGCSCFYRDCVTLLGNCGVRGMARPVLGRSGPCRDSVSSGEQSSMENLQI
jgi:hypothetical protein